MAEITRLTKRLLPHRIEEHPRFLEKVLQNWSELAAAIVMDDNICTLKDGDLRNFWAIAIGGNEPVINWETYPYILELLNVVLSIPVGSAEVSSNKCFFFSTLYYIASLKAKQIAIIYEICTSVMEMALSFVRTFAHPKKCHSWVLVPFWLLQLYQQGKASVSVSFFSKDFWKGVKK